MKKKKTSFEKTIDTAWSLFEKTGDISYYLLYKNLKDE
ncbi:MAG: YqzL family protein [Clostridia bacterium]|nr:YqzL family protein [Clostridia bacterium]